MTSNTQLKKRLQRTLHKAVEYSGIGLHTGEVVHLKMLPAPADSGIVFKRTDLPNTPLIPAIVPNVCDTSDRCTVLGKDGCKIYTVEHLLAALYANHVDNVLIEISNIEPPVGNGSSDVFVDLIQQAGIQEQSTHQPLFELKQPLYFSQGDIHLVALPCESYRVSYTLNYPKSPALKTQYNSFEISPDTFNKELSPCRTFCLYEEISALMDKGLIKGGSLDNAVVVKGEAYLSKNGLFFPDEPARHKILDIVGDLALVGCDIRAHILGVRAGHAANYMLAKQLYHLFSSESSS